MSIPEDAQEAGKRNSQIAKPQPFSNWSYHFVQ